MKSPAPSRRLRSLSALCLICLLAGLGCESTGGSRHAIDGAWIVTLDDGDAVPAAFTGAEADAVEQAEGDTITALRLPLPDRAEAIEGDVEFDQEAAPSDAVGSNPAMAVSADGTLVATVGPMSMDPPSQMQIRNFRLGEGVQVRLFRLGEDGLSLIGAVELSSEGGEQVSVAFHPFERRLAVLQRSDPSLHLIDIGPDGEWLSGAMAVDLSGYVEVTDDPSSIAWHPSGRFIAMTLERAGEAGFFELTSLDGEWTISSWGNRVATGPFPQRGVFSPDGRYFLTAEMGVMDEPGMEVISAAGSVSVIRVADSMGMDAQHERTTNMWTTYRPRVMAISPDGRLLALASHRKEDLEIARSETLTGGRLMLYGFDPISGELIPSDTSRTTPLPGALAFDADSSHLLVANYLNDEVQVWRVRGGNGFSLEFTGLTIGTGVRPHDLAVAPRPEQ